MDDIIIVDDEKDIRSLLSGILEDEGYSTRSAADSDGFFTLLRERIPSLILLDIWLKRSVMDGMEILLKMRQSYADIPIIMISGHGTVETAVRAMQSGAYNFLEKPIKIDHLLLLVSRALEARRISQEHKIFVDKLVHDPIELQGESQAIQAIRALALKHAPNNSRILMTGEAGTGKQTLAKFIHDNSLRSKGAFLAVSFKNKTQDQIEIELFGASEMNDPNMPCQAGALEKAHNGTVFMDGIEHLSKSTQQKLTKFLVEKQYARIMAPQKTVQCDVRVIASCHISPEEACAEGLLTSDFFQRLNVVRLNMPSLRERREDLTLLIGNISSEIAALHDLKAPEFLDEAMIALQIYDWPGNIRQLRNVIEHIVIMANDNDDAPISVADLPHELRDTVPPIGGNQQTNYMNLSLREAREIFEREYLLAQLSRFKSNVSKTAQFIGMERSALHRKLRGLGIAGRYASQFEDADS
ncbi:MAG: sigma-54 dependent transcriptional regulator [Pseudomonadota bacterium]